MNDSHLQRANAKVAGKLLLVVVAMFGFGFALVPLYDVFCEITGLNGKTGRISAAESENFVVDANRQVTVEFIANISGNSGSWRFAPKLQRMRVNPGQLYTAYFEAENLAAAERSAQAVPSVTPGIASKYFEKTECFCFTQQHFAATTSREMPVTFVIDPRLPKHITTVTLAYTFFGVDSAIKESAANVNTDSKT